MAVTRVKKVCQPRMFPKLVNILLWCTGTSTWYSEFALLLRNIDSRCAAHGNKFRVQYMKSCVALVVSFLNESHAEVYPSVALTRDRLPLVLPVGLRHVLRSMRSSGGSHSVNVLCRLTITVLSFYRLLSFKSPVDVSSITDPGPEMDLGVVTEIGRAAFQLRKRRGGWQYRNSRPKTSETAGPNGPRAAWFAGADALAFLTSRENMLQARYLLRFCFMTKQY